MRKRILYTLATLLLLTACNPNTPSAISVKNKIYKHPEKMQYLKFATDSVCYYGDFGNETLNNKTFAYTQKDEVVTVFTPTPEHLLAYEGFVLRGDTIYELFADTSDPSYQDHQPTDPKAFSLVGKVFAVNAEAIGFCDTLCFITDSTALKTFQSQYKECTYRLAYPRLSLFFETDERPLLFQDTTTLYSEWWEETFYLVPPTQF